VTGKVTKVADFGIFIELEGGVEGLIHVSESGLEPSMKLEEKFKLQDDVAAKIIKVDREERKIALSLRDHQLDWERKQVDDYHSTQGVLDQSIGRAAKQSRKRSQAEDQN
jgi:small subunit ribosomal protein S1